MSWINVGHSFSQFLGQFSGHPQGSGRNSKNQFSSSNFPTTLPNFVGWIRMFPSVPKFALLKHLKSMFLVTHAHTHIDRHILIYIFVKVTSAFWIILARLNHKPSLFNTTFLGWDPVSALILFQVAVVQLSTVETQSRTDQSRQVRLESCHVLMICVLW